MATIDWVVLCVKVERDAKDLSINLLRIVGTQAPPMLPIAAPLTVVFSLAGKMGETGTWSLMITHPNGREYRPEEAQNRPFDLGPHGWLVVHLAFELFGVTEVGTYRFDVLVGGVVAGTVSLRTLPPQSGDIPQPHETVH